MESVLNLLDTCVVCYLPSTNISPQKFETNQRKWNSVEQRTLEMRRFAFENMGAICLQDKSQLTK